MVETDKVKTLRLVVGYVTTKLPGIFKRVLLSLGGVLFIVSPLVN